MAVTSANKVADYILCKIHEYGDLITNLKLQKLVYYAQAWFLALYDEPLFPERLEAWIHGPTQPDLYRRFKDSRWNPISENPDCPQFDDSRVQPHLDEILDVYGDLTTHHLERLTHQEAPWKIARNGLPLDVESTAEISHEDMRSFYKKMAA